MQKELLNEEAVKILVNLLRINLDIHIGGSFSDRISLILRVRATSCPRGSSTNGSTYAYTTLEINMQMVGQVALVTGSKNAP